ncbi:Mediator of RNA polymerase II transcription subunit 23, partial [Xenoophorus captivus]
LSRSLQAVLGNSASGFYMFTFEIIPAPNISVHKLLFSNCLHICLQESHEQCVQWIVRFIHSQHSPKRISFLYDCLAMAVETSLLTPRSTHTHLFKPDYRSPSEFLIICPIKLIFFFRMVCVALISSDSLEWERTRLWALTFKLIRKIIGGGVRDLLKAVLDKIQTIPTTVSSAIVQQLLAAREVLNQSQLYAFLCLSVLLFVNAGNASHFRFYVRLCCR